MGERRCFRHFLLIRKNFLLCTSLTGGQGRPGRKPCGELFWYSIRELHKCWIFEYWIRVVSQMLNLDVTGEHRRGTDVHWSWSPILQNPSSRELLNMRALQKSYHRYFMNRWLYCQNTLVRWSSVSSQSSSPWQGWWQSASRSYNQMLLSPGKDGSYLCDHLSFSCSLPVVSLQVFSFTFTARRDLKWQRRGDLHWRHGKNKRFGPFLRTFRFSKIWNGTKNPVVLTPVDLW